MLHRIHFVEKWGSGLRRIYDECRENGMKARFAKEESGFNVIFPRTGVKNVPENVPEKRQKAILGMLAKNGKTSIPELAKFLHLNEKTIKRDLEKLKASKRLNRVGPDKGGRWEVN